MYTSGLRSSVLQLVHKCHYCVQGNAFMISSREREFIERLLDCSITVINSVVQASKFIKFILFLERCRRERPSF